LQIVYTESNLLPEQERFQLRAGGPTGNSVDHEIEDSDTNKRP
jgi:hypothetical protein